MQAIEGLRISASFDDRLDDLHVALSAVGNQVHGLSLRRGVAQTQLPKFPALLKHLNYFGLACSLSHRLGC